MKTSTDAMDSPPEDMQLEPIQEQAPIKQHSQSEGAVMIIVHALDNVQQVGSPAL